MTDTKSLRELAEKASAVGATWHRKHREIWSDTRRQIDETLYLCEVVFDPLGFQCPNLVESQDVAAFIAAANPAAIIALLRRKRHLSLPEPL